MKKDTWKTIIQIAISILTAIATTLGVTSCMGSQRRFIGLSFHRIPIIKVTQISQMTQIFLSSTYPQMRPIRSDYADFPCDTLKICVICEICVTKKNYLRDSLDEFRSRRFRR